MVMRYAYVAYPTSHNTHLHSLHPPHVVWVFYFNGYHCCYTFVQPKHLADTGMSALLIRMDRECKTVEYSEKEAEWLLNHTLNTKFCPAMHHTLCKIHLHG